MKITIDTKEDSKEEIKKVISLLQTLLNESYTNIYEEKNELPKRELFNMFDSEKSESKSEIKKIDESEEDFKEGKFELETY